MHTGYMFVHIFSHFICVFYTKCHLFTTLSKDFKDLRILFLSNNARGMNNILKILKSLEKKLAQKLLSKDLKD